jgi:hypothetical protein
VAPPKHPDAATTDVCHIDRDVARSSSNGLTRRERLRAILTSCLSVAFAGAVFMQTVSRPADAPILFAVTSSWLIVCFVRAFTTKAFEQMNVTRFRLHNWERAGLIYEWCGIRLFRWCIVRTPIAWLNPQMTLRGGGQISSACSGR